ncbi:tRNA lysidine(34) synthetase TilS [Tenuibacillus multivorans]|uniref:tRNA(Ile)-lysidine synthase n=1 Tax=Tenuibacillus multivorans TaxID=237069 RepID=A0A1G9VXU1_9BACI|nr:tRNA lysidine(34) synthetase TilS [Tenuibacillus multivorans]GEL78243.1 tRNA(Ile)-lysidine synthase [Tenuibacillus multivorans]SDM77109.1 tRNA(Ile)-lysidine synthase [Tenuibacillus multivorans]
MKDKILADNQKHQLFNKGDTLFLAVSGGPDSLALLHFFASIQTSWDLTLYTLTVDHQLREQDSFEDALFVKKQSESLGIPCQIGRVDVKQYQKEQQVGTQAAARALRYQFFQKKMKDTPQAKLVLAHHQDDLVESLVMQFIKGVRPTGMPIKRRFGEQVIIRPFLCLTKDELWQYLNDLQMTPRIDQSNEDIKYTRNRVRQKIIPLLKEENPNLQNGLSRLHEQLEEEDQFLNRLAKEKLDEIATFQKENLTFSLKAFKEFSLPLQRRAFHLILNYLDYEKSIDKDYFQGFKEWIESGQPNGQFVIMDRLTFIKAYDQCYIQKGKHVASSYDYQLSLDETITLPNGWLMYLSEVAQSDPGNQDSLICDKHHITLPITVRSRKNGDRIQPLGMKGHQKIKDIFINEKIPQYLRDEWPIIVNGDGEIIWIPYICKSHLVKDSGKQNIKITIDINN